MHSRNHQEAASGAQKVSKFFSLEDFETLQKKFFEGPSALQKSPGGCLAALRKFLSSFPLKTLKLSRKIFLKAPVHSRKSPGGCLLGSEIF